MTSGRPPVGYVPRGVMWGENQEKLEDLLGVNNPKINQIYAQIVRIFEDKVHYKKDGDNYVCVIWDPECENECVAFFVKDFRETIDLGKDLVDVPNELSYDIFRLEK